MNKTRIILGLDVSTATIGVCLMCCNGEETKILELTHVSPKVSNKIIGIESLFLKKQIFVNELLVNYKNYGITDVVIEEPLMNSNNRFTVSTLLRFNGMISDSVYNTLGLVPSYISSHDARAYSFPELIAIRSFNKKNIKHPIKTIHKAIKNNELVLFGNYVWDIGKKDVILDKVSEKFTDIKWLYNKKGELKKENFDSSDAIACCLGYLNKTIHGEMNPTITNVSEFDDKILYEVKIWDKIFKHTIIK